GRNPLGSLRNDVGIADCALVSKTLPHLGVDLLANFHGCTVVTLCELTKGLAGVQFGDIAQVLPTE
ncbi:hypothetical protein PJN92_30050, partial [Mycobacterium kansasii]